MWGGPHMMVTDPHKLHTDAHHSALFRFKRILTSPEDPDSTNNTNLHH